ncbi:MAG: DUF255 domain-containing protein [Pirellulales bacterium]
MSHPLRPLLAASLLSLALAVTSGPPVWAQADDFAVASDAPAWHDDVSRAWQDALEQDRPLLMYITSPSCGFCRKMTATTYADRQVASLVSETVVAVAVDGQRQQAARPPAPGTCISHDPSDRSGTVVKLAVSRVTSHPRLPPSPGRGDRPLDRPPTGRIAPDAPGFNVVGHGRFGVSRLRPPHAPQPGRHTSTVVIVVEMTATPPTSRPHLGALPLWPVSAAPPCGHAGPTLVQ